MGLLLQAWVETKAMEWKNRLSGKNIPGAKITQEGHSDNHQGYEKTADFLEKMPL